MFNPLKLDIDGVDFGLQLPARLGASRVYRTGVQAIETIGSARRIEIHRLPLYRQGFYPVPFRRGVIVGGGTVDNVGGESFLLNGTALASSGFHRHLRLRPQRRPHHFPGNTDGTRPFETKALRLHRGNKTGVIGSVVAAGSGGLVVGFHLRTVPADPQVLSYRHHLFQRLHCFVGITFLRQCHRAPESGNQLYALCIGSVIPFRRTLPFGDGGILHIQIPEPEEQPRIFRFVHRRIRSRLKDLNLHIALRGDAGSRQRIGRGSVVHAVLRARGSGAQLRGFAVRS